MLKATTLQDKEDNSLIESASTVGQPARAVCNPDGSNIGSGNSSLPATFVPAQNKIVTTGMAIRLSNYSLIEGVIISAFSGNQNPLVIGHLGVTNIYDGSGNGYILEPGCSTSVAVANTDAIYINGTAGDIFSFIGS